MRSLTSPEMVPLYWPTQARSDWIARRSACAIALAVSAGVCKAGRIGTVVTCFGLAPAVEGGVNCAWAAPVAMNINVAVSIDLMTNLGSMDASAADLKFLHHPRQTRIGTSNRKRHYNLKLASTLCFPKFVCEDAEPDHELRKAGTSAIKHICLV